MLDGSLRRLLDPALERLARVCLAAGLTADRLTVAGFLASCACGIAIALQADALALAMLALSRLCDGLDGTVARATRPTDRGGFIDIVFDFLFYGLVPLAFALRDPGVNALPAAVLLASFYANGASFLAFAAIAARRGMTSAARGPKALYFTTGLAEGSETIAAFALMILLPAWFPMLAYAFAALCALTCAARILLGWRLFAVDDAGRTP